MFLNACKFLTIAAALLAALLPLPGHALDASGAVGVDVWRVNDTARYLPNYSTARPWRPVSAWAQVAVKHTTQTPFGGITATVAGRAHEVEGGRVERLDLDFQSRKGAGLRLGVLPYRLTWCRPLGEGPWMLEPDAYCRFHGLREVAQGAFGGQLYATGAAGGWLIDGMAGVYRPNIDGQDDQLGPYVSVGPTIAHTKHGVSANAMHLRSGLHLRAAWLHTQQTQDSRAGSFQRRMAYDMVYAAVEMPVATALTLRASLNANLGHQSNPVNEYRWRGQSITTEAHYKPAHRHTLALAWSEYRNTTTYARGPNGQRVVVPSVSAAWRYDFDSGLAATVQVTHTKDTARNRRGAVNQRGGAALGVRIAKTF